MLKEHEVVEKVLDHDRHLDQLTASIKSLVDVQKETNRKIDKLVEGLNQVALLQQKVASMDSELKESFKRVHTKTDKSSDKIEKLEDGSIDHTANIKSNQKRLDTIEASITWVTRTVIGALVTGAITAVFIVAK